MTDDKLLACLALLLAIFVGGCAILEHERDRPLAIREGPPITNATFCEVMAAQGGPFTWSPLDTRKTKERADKLNAVWKRCPQYKPPVKP